MSSKDSGFSKDQTPKKPSGDHANLARPLFGLSESKKPLFADLSGTGFSPVLRNMVEADRLGVEELHEQKVAGVVLTDRSTIHKALVKRDRDCLQYLATSVANLSRKRIKSGAAPLSRDLGVVPVLAERLRSSGAEIEGIIATVERLKAPAMSSGFAALYLVQNRRTAEVTRGQLTRVLGNFRSALDSNYMVKVLFGENFKTHELAALAKKVASSDLMGSGDWKEFRDLVVSQAASKKPFASAAALALVGTAHLTESDTQSDRSAELHQIFSRVLSVAPEVPTWLQAVALSLDLKKVPSLELIGICSTCPELLETAVDILLDRAAPRSDPDDFFRERQTAVDALETGVSLLRKRGMRFPEETRSKIAKNIRAVVENRLSPLDSLSGRLLVLAMRAEPSASKRVEFASACLLSVDLGISPESKCGVLMALLSELYDLGDNLTKVGRLHTAPLQKTIDLGLATVADIIDHPRRHQWFWSPAEREWRSETVYAAFSMLSNYNTEFVGSVSRRSMGIEARRWMLVVDCR